MIVPILLLHNLRLDIQKFGHLQMHVHAMCMESFINNLWESPRSSTYVVTPLQRQRW